MSDIMVDSMKDPVIMQSCSETHLVSTVHLIGKWETLETMVFKLSNGQVDWSDLSCDQTTEMSQAAMNHLNACIKFNVHPESKWTQ